MQRASFLQIGIVLCLVPLSIASSLTPAAPEEVGLSAGRLVRIAKAMEDDVAGGRIPGAVAMVIRKGRIAYLEWRGAADREAARPMSKDTIFRIYSMTKPITSLAVMMLYEEGRIGIRTPVSRYIPELGRLKVLVENPDGTRRLEDSRRDMTVQDLLRHTSGLTYGFFAKSAVDQMYQNAGILREENLAEFTAKLGRIPLKHQPGSTWEYSVSTDVLGRLVEVVSGMPLDRFFQKRIFEPLQMTDTGFVVPEAKRSRFAQLYAPDRNGGIRPADSRQSRSFLQQGNFFSGGGGLVSTAADYARFCQMMINGGQLDGVRLLSRKTVEFMTVDHVGEGPTNRRSFGLGFAVVKDLAAGGVATSTGEYSWGGAAGTKFWIDPKEQLIGIYMVQILPHTGLSYGDTFKVLTYQSIAD